VIGGRAGRVAHKHAHYRLGDVAPCSSIRIHDVEVLPCSEMGSQARRERLGGGSHEELVYVLVFHIVPTMDGDGDHAPR
jgi:hypothetical protein